MKQDYTDITFVLDRSGSMSSIADDMIGGVNQLIEDQKAVPGKATVSIYQFDNQQDVIFESRDINNVPLLTRETYVPRGSTALHDAIGLRMVQTGERLAKLPEEERPGKVVFIVVTDGEENCSREWNASKLAPLVEKQTKEYSWQVVFLGANQNAVLTGRSFGASVNTSMSYVATPVATRNTLKATSDSLTSFRQMTEPNATLCFTDDQRAASMNSNV